MEAFFEWEEQLLMFLQNSVRGPVLDTIMQFITSLGDGGFLAIAACLVLLLVPRWRKVGIPAVILAALIAFSRLYLGAHFPTDVMGGAVIGCLTGVIAWKLVWKRK